MPFQNGVESADILLRHLPAKHVAAGVAYVAAVITEPGVIRHTSMDQLIFGELDGRRSARLEAFLAACRKTSFQAMLSEHIQTDLWSKFVRLTTFSGLTAAARSPVGVIRADPDLAAMTEAAWQEGLAVAKAMGVMLPPEAIDEMRAMWNGMPPAAKSSMLEDLERGHRLELPWLSEAIVRLGRNAGIETPVHRFLAAVLRPHVNGRAH